MKFYSEITKDFYDSEKECTKAEKEFTDKQEKEKLAKEAKKAERKKRATEVEDAYKAMKEAEKTYYKLRNEFINDFGYYHISYSDKTETPLTTLFEDLFKF